MRRWSYHVPILAYHRVGAFKGDHVPTVSSRAFEANLTWLAARRTRVMGLDDLVRALDTGTTVPRRSTIITFDDGYEDTCTVAWPLLKRFGFPATVFVTPTEVGRPGFATWEQLQAAAAEGLVIGSHTMHHCYLPLVPSDRLSEELIESKRVIEERLRHPVRFLSYPVGGFTPAILTLTRAAGYRAACTTNRVADSNGMDRFALRRIKVTERDRSGLLLVAKLSGYYDAFRQLRAPS